jgi:hypothetical protein
MDVSKLNDSQFEDELNEMLRKVDIRMQEQGARAQAMAANSALALMGLVDFGKLEPGLREKYVFDVFRLCSYAIAGMPVVQNAMASVHRDLAREGHLAMIVRAFSFLFETDPESLIKTMLAGSTKAAT